MLLEFYNHYLQNQFIFKIKVIFVVSETPVLRTVTIFMAANVIVRVVLIRVLFVALLLHLLLSFTTASLQHPQYRPVRPLGVGIF